MTAIRVIFDGKALPRDVGGLAFQSESPDFDFPSMSVSNDEHRGGYKTMNDPGREQGATCTC
jgi:hypothetical protein